MIVAVCEASDRGFTSGNNADNEKGFMMDYTNEQHLEHITYIDRSGIGLDEYGNEYRDEDGMIFLVPEQYRQHYKVLERE